MKLALAAVVLAFLGIYVAVELGSSNFVPAIAFAGLLGLLLLSRLLGKDIPLDGFFLVCGVCLFQILGKGFAYLHVGPVLFSSEILVGICGVGYLARLYSRRFSLFPPSTLTKPLMLLTIYCTVLMVVNYGRFGIMAARDFCIVYYSFVFFASYELSRSWDGFGDRAVRLMLWVTPIVWGADILDHFAPAFAGAIRMKCMSFLGTPLFIPHEPTQPAILGLGSYALVRSQSGRFGILWAMLGVAALGYLVVGARGAAVVAVAFLVGILAVSGIRAVFTVLVPGAVFAAAVVATLAAVNSKVADRVEALSDQISDLNVVERLKRMDSHQSTISWRLLWWKKILIDVNARNPLFGLGFGHDLGSDFQEYFQGAANEDSGRTRFPHNAFFSFLGRTGWVGATLFMGVVAGQLVYLWRIRRLIRERRLPRGSFYLLGAWAYSFVVTFAQYTWEAGYSAIPFWLISGILFQQTDQIRSGEMDDSGVEESVPSSLSVREIRGPVLAG